MPALLATASLTAVLFHEDIPGFSAGHPNKNSAATPDQTGAPDSAKATVREEQAADARAAEHGEKNSERSADLAIAKDDKAAAPIPGGVAALFDRTFTLKQWGREANWALSLDEISVIDSDGKEHVHLLQPPATPETYEARIAKYANQGRVLPVVYPEGEEGSAKYRLLVTKDLMVEIPKDADREAIVGTLDLPAKALPAWAPNLALVSADSPLAALASIDKLRENSKLVTAQVMLAMQMGKRAMPNDPQVNKQWHLKYNNAFGVTQGTDINVESVWNYPNATETGIRGTGVVVGVLDDGLETDHPDFVGNINTTIDWDFNGGIDGDNDPSPVGDDDHGTACAGDVGARGNNGVGVSGSAPEATLVGYRLISGPISQFDIGNALAYEMQNVHVKSNSWGPPDQFLLKTGPDAFEHAALVDSVTNGRGGKGTVFLWAGGNGNGFGDNSNYDGFANSIYAIGVGAMDSLMRRSSYSEIGANLLVTAPSNGNSPAHGKTTTDRTGSDGYSTSDYTDTFGGTSSATPTTAGVVALILQKNPNLTYRDVQEIIATSAKKINPNDAGWVTNSAGFHFHHSYGAGLIDAAAAVALAQNWVPLGASISKDYDTAVAGPIPENDPAGLVRTFDLSDSDVRIEHVTVEVDIAHTSRGNLEITLTSPSGVTSRLAEVHGDQENNYNWKFMTTHNWGELSNGTWTLKVADRSALGNTSGGTLVSATLTVQGSAAPAINPAPQVQITSPANGTVFTPGSTIPVTVTASDLNEEGEPGVVTKVELFDNGTLVGTDTTEPYTFEITPADGPHALIAKATDNVADPDTGVGESGTVNIELRNSAPIITAATIGATPAYSDTALTVSGIVANDQDGDPATFAYLWQKSSDGRNYTDAIDKTTASLPAAPENAGLLWRCKITPSDAQNTGVPFFTNVVNVVARPQTLVAPGATYSYQSGLVLKSNGSPITRDAIINEFSQGPANGSVSGISEWVEILTLRPVSLRNWSIKESSDIRITFANSSVWDNVPAGTRIVIYNGGVPPNTIVSKDPKLPADDFNHSDRVMVIPHSNATYFTGVTWPSLSNTGDMLSLRNASDAKVSEVGFGVLSGDFINIGEVGTQNAAYYTGDSDEGSNLSANWLVTDSMVARTDIGPKAPGDLIISEIVIGPNDTSNDKAVEIFNPTSLPVNLATAAYQIVIFEGAKPSPPLVEVSLTGTVPAGGTFVVRRKTAASALHVPGRELATTDLDFTFTGDDPIVLRKAGVVVDSMGSTNNQDPGIGWFTNANNNTGNKNIRRNPGILVGETVHSDPYNTAAALGQWTFVSRTDYSGIGKHDTTIKFFGLSASVTQFAENAGAAVSTGTITLPQAATADVVFTLTSSATDVLTVPATVTIPSGQSSVTFPINAVDDTISDGPQTPTIEAAASGYQTAVITLTVTDNEAPIIGVTPGKGNNAANSAWIADLVAGIEDAPSVFRLAAGSTLPTGLSLNTTTGLISGTVNAAATGSFNVVIERYNADGDVTSQSYTLSIGTEVTYASWISGFPGLSSNDPEADPENDGLKNLLEFYLGLNPGVTNSDIIDTERTETSLSITFRRAKALGGITGGAQWSDDLGVTWSNAGVTEQILEQTANDELVKASIALTPADTKKFIRLKVIQNP